MGIVHSGCRLLKEKVERVVPRRGVWDIFVAAAHQPWRRSSPNVRVQQYKDPALPITLTATLAPEKAEFDSQFPATLTPYDATRVT
jgi:hypothetical protein